MLHVEVPTVPFKASILWSIYKYRLRLGRMLSDVLGRFLNTDFDYVRVLTAGVTREQGMLAPLRNDLWCFR